MSKNLMIIENDESFNSYKIVEVSDDHPLLDPSLDYIDCDDEYSADFYEEYLALSEENTIDLPCTIDKAISVYLY